MWMLWMACTATIRVETSIPGAEIGVVSADTMPREGELWAQHRGTGSLDAQVYYSVFDTWWAWARAEGYETSIVALPTKLAGGPTASCAVGVLLFPFLAGCFFVSKPRPETLYIDMVPADTAP